MTIKIKKKVKFSPTATKPVSKQVMATVSRYIKSGGKVVAPTLFLDDVPALMTDAQLSKRLKSAKSAVSTDASGIAKENAIVKKQQGIMDKTDDYLNKTNGYKTKKGAYDSITKQISDAETKLKKTKKAADKKKLQTSIDKMKKAQKAAFTDLKKLTSSKGYQEQLKKQSTARRTANKAKNKISSLKTKKLTDKAKLKALKKEYNARKAEARHKLQVANKAKIDDKIAKRKELPLMGQTALYRADLMKSTVFFLGEVQPTETDANETTSIGVDKSDPRAGKSTRTTKELSGTYWLQGKNYAAVSKQFAALQKLQRLDTEFVIRGFSHWNHVKMASISKTVSGVPKDTGLELSITFDYVKQANILYEKKKKKTKSKGAVKSSKKNGTDKGKYKSHTVKSGDTYWDLAKKYHTTVAELTKLNGSRFKTMFPGKKLKIPK